MVLLVIEFPNGRIFSLVKIQDRATDELYEFVAEYWHEMPAEVGKIPSEKLKAIELYLQGKRRQGVL